MEQTLRDLPERREKIKNPFCIPHRSSVFLRVCTAYMNECLFQRKNPGEMFERDEQEKKGGCFLFSVMSERLGRQKNQYANHV